DWLITCQCCILSGWATVWTSGIGGMGVANSFYCVCGINCDWVVCARENSRKCGIFQVEKEGKTHAFPVRVVFRQHLKPFLSGVFLATAGYVLFYILAAFAQILCQKAQPHYHPPGIQWD
ncbi:hypothetical protein AAUPMC_13151, partial [Pasteurella multocida subsp. multocida str. Anand1_cattle]